MTDEELERLLDGGSVGEASSSAQVSASAPTDAGAADKGDDSIYSFDGKNFAPDKAAARRGGLRSAGCPSRRQGQWYRRRRERHGAGDGAAEASDGEMVRKRRRRRQQRRRGRKRRQATQGGACRETRAVAKAGYTSLALAAEVGATAAGGSGMAAAAAAEDDGETDVDTDADEGADDEAGQRAVGGDDSLRFVVGDAAAARGGGDGGGSRIVLCWVDDRGRWPERGFFGAVTGQLGDGPRLACRRPCAWRSETGRRAFARLQRQLSGMLLCLIVVLARDGCAAWHAADALDGSARRLAVEGFLRRRSQRVVGSHASPPSSVGGLVRSRAAATQAPATAGANFRVLLCEEAVVNARGEDVVKEYLDVGTAGTEIVQDFVYLLRKSILHRIYTARV